MPDCSNELCKINKQFRLHHILEKTLTKKLAILLILIKMRLRNKQHQIVRPLLLRLEHNNTRLQKNSFMLEEESKILR